MLDVLCVAGVVALFVVVGLIGKAVEKLGSGSPSPRGEDRA